MRESALERMLTQRVYQLGGLALKFSSPGRRHMPDRLILFPEGLIYFVELKASRKKPSQAQTRLHQQFAQLGFPVLVIDHPQQIEQLIPELTQELR